MTIADEATRDRALGAFLGLAIGDALGTTLEFAKRDSQPRLTDIVGGGPFGLPAGEWTDDTSMALALAESLAASGGLSPDDLMRRFTAWYRDGAYSPRGRCFDIGGATRAALERYDRTGDPFAGSVDPGSAGNGSIMRLAPVALAAYPDAEAAAYLAREQSRTTHAALECLESCDLLARILCAAIAGGGKASLRQPAWLGSGRLTAIASGASETKLRAEISSSGYVVATLEAALWSTAQADTFEDALLAAVNLADDADTVGAVTGQIAGAVFGASAIPAHWMERLAWRERLVGAAHALVDAPVA